MTESVLVMIPLLITFLSVLQISTGVMARAVSTNIVQGAAARIAIDGAAANEITPGSNVGSVDLPGGGTINIVSRQIHQVAISPLLPGGDNYEATGIAVSE